MSNPTEVGSRPQVLKLQWDDKGKVIVVPENEDLMLLTREEAVKACSAYTQTLRFDRQFQQLLERLGDWLTPRRESIALAFLTVRDAGLLFLAVQQSVEYNDDLDDDITRLDLEIANDSDFDLIRMDVMILPNVSEASYQSFLTSRARIELTPRG